jgi:PAS domain S-box-containing protein
MSEDLLRLNRELQERLDEAEETLRALRSGEVDAIVAAGPEGDRVYTLKGADEAYRVMVQGMAEGALTLTLDGLILFSNEQFANMLQVPLERVIGSRVQDLVAPEDALVLSALLSGANGRKAEMRLRTGGVALTPVYLSMDNLILDGAECICLMVTDLTEPKRNQEIAAAEKLARSILEQAADAMLVVDPDGRIGRASRAADFLAGVSVVHRRFDEVFQIRLDAGESYPFREILSRVKQSGAFNSIEATALTSAGRKIELLLSAALLSGPDAGILGCVVTLTDISERTRREREMKFQADIIETTTEAVVAIDPSRRVTFWNSGAERLYGVVRKEAVGKPLESLYQYLWLNPGDEHQFRAAFDKQGMWSGDNIHIRRDGTRIFVSSTVNRIGPEHGGGMLAVIRDITENKQAEAILRESEARERGRVAEMQAIMQAVPVAVFITHDSECRDMRGNRMGCELLRLPFDSNVSMTAPPGEKPGQFRAVRNGKEIPSHELPLQFAARTGQSVNDYEFDLVFDDGPATTCLGNAEPLFDEAGQPRGAVGAFVDITGRKRDEERLRQTQKLESIGLLAGGIAHDFNNLLVGVIGNAGLALDMLQPGDEAVEFIEGVIRAGEQLATLTRQMLAYSGKGRFFLKRLNLSHLIPEMSRLVQPSIPKKIALDFELAPDLPPVEADPSHMQQIFMNLVLNAAEAIGSNSGRISIKTGVQAVDQQYIRQNPEAADLQPGDYVYLEVRDTGSGMEPATMKKIFEPFFSTKFIGRGLGLAAVSGIVRVHKGAIQVTSALNKGTCFTVLLPATQGATPQEEVAEKPLPFHATGTVLVVDDEKVVRETARKALTRHGLDVLVANNAIEAIDILKRHSGEISLVVLDLSMPGMSGEEALPELRKIRPGIKVVISSGYNEAETMTLFKGQRVSGFIQKPYTPTTLAEKVKSTLG